MRKPAGPSGNSSRRPAATAPSRSRPASTSSPPPTHSPTTYAKPSTPSTTPADLRTNLSQLRSHGADPGFAGTDSLALTGSRRSQRKPAIALARSPSDARSTASNAPHYRPARRDGGDSLAGQRTASYRTAREPVSAQSRAWAGDGNRAVPQPTAPARSRCNREPGPVPGEGHQRWPSPVSRCCRRPRARSMSRWWRP